jgi:aldehyde dehydrogenase
MRMVILSGGNLSFRLQQQHMLNCRMSKLHRADNIKTRGKSHVPASSCEAKSGPKQSGVGRKNRKMMLDHYRQTKKPLVSYSPRAVGFF